MPSGNASVGRLWDRSIELRGNAITARRRGCRPNSRVTPSLEVPNKGIVISSFEATHQIGSAIFETASNQVFYGQALMRSLLCEGAYEKALMRRRLREVA